MVSLAERRRGVTYLRNQYAISERRACEALSMHRSSYRYGTRETTTDPAYQRIVKLSDRYSYFGYRKIYGLVRQEALPISRERVRTIRRREGLQVVRKPRKRRILGLTTEWVRRAQYPNHVWSYDFVFDQTEDGRQLKCLTVVDEFTRHGLAIEIARSVTAGDVIRTLERLFQVHGQPSCLRSDNGPELVSAKVQNWLKAHQVDTHYIDPGCPWQNPYNESFNSILRTTCLDRWLFTSLTEARVVTKHWLAEYNTIRPHGSLGGISPEQFLQQWQQQHLNQPKSLTL